LSTSTGKTGTALENSCLSWSRTESVFTDEALLKMNLYFSFDASPRGEDGKQGKGQGVE
jgi:hypothetical protein